MSYVWAVLLIWCVFMDLPAWSDFSLTNPEWIGVILAASVALVGIGYKIGPWLWKRTVTKYANFNLRFIDHPPPDHTVHNYWFPYLLPIGTFKLCCFVQAVSTVGIAKLNFRFKNEDGSNVPKSIADIILIEECECDPCILESVSPDTQGGMDGLVKSNVPALAISESRYFWITAKAFSPLTGYLSFRAQDTTGFRSYGRHKVVISEALGSPLLVKDALIGSGYISMNEAAQRVYTEARRAQHLWAITAEQGGASEEEILNRMALRISEGKDVYGKRPPSTELENISRDDIRAGRFIEGATKLKGMFNTSIGFTHLSIKVEDLNDLIEQIQFEGGFWGESKS